MTSQENEESTNEQEQRSFEHWFCHFCGSDTLCGGRLVEAVLSYEVQVAVSACQGHRMSPSWRHATRLN